MNRRCPEFSPPGNPTRCGCLPTAIIATPVGKLLGVPLLIGLMSGLLEAQVSRLGKAGLRPKETNVEGSGSRWIIQRPSRHQARWESILQVTNPTGRVQMQTNAFEVLASGLNYFHEDQWLESREEIEITDDGAVARHGAHQVAFAANLNVAGAIVLITPDGQTLRSHILGLAYSDAAVGKSILIGGIKDSVGSIHGNRVHYADAFDGSFRADVSYTYTRSGLEQDVVLREQLPSPAEFGLDPVTTRLEVWTEFLQPPVPERTSRPLKANRAGAGMPITDSDFSDETLSFGTMMIGSGVAFPLERPAPDSTDAPVPVGKEWLTLRGRTFLIEKVDYADVEAEVLRLPKAGVARTKDPKVPAERQVVLAGLVAPPTPVRTNNRERMEFSVQRSPQAGYVVDYSIVTTLANHVFRADTTYLVAGDCILSGTTVIEGGTVVKFIDGNRNRILVTGPVDCQTSTYRPAYFVSMNDDTVGGQIPGAANSPAGLPPSGGLDLDWRGGTIQLHDLRFRNLHRALSAGNGTLLTLSHSQIQACEIGVQALAGSTVWLRNVLLVDILDTAFALAAGSGLRGEHLTLHRVRTFRNSTYGIPTGAMDLANSLLVAVTNLSIGPYSDWRKVFVEPSDAGVFQAAGHGSRYLAADSPFRGAGDINVDPNLLRELRRSTTHPPVVLSGPIRQDVILRPMVQRNCVAGANPDIGYAYDAMDYLLRSVLLEGSPGQPITLSVTNGAVLGVDPAASGVGIQLGTYSSLLSVGRAENLNRIVPVQTIQEGLFAGKSWFFTQVHGVGLGGYPKASLRLTELCVPAGRLRHFANWGGSFANLDLQDCRLAGGEFYLSPDNPSHAISVRNCLFERVKFTFHPYARAALNVYNNLFKDGTLAIDMDPPNPPGSAPWFIRDNLFDGTQVSQLADLPAGAATHNGYVLTQQNQTRLRPLPSGNTDRILSASPRYEVFGTGRYYLPSGESLLRDQGSRSASAAGLYHYTTRASQMKEGPSTVDIGLHYIALSENASSDVDQDGVSDYLEDQNGDGITTGLETRWNGYESRYRLTGQPGLSVFTPVR